MDFSHSQQRPAPNFTGLTVVVGLHVFIAVIVIYFGAQKIKKAMQHENVAVVEIKAPPPPPPPPDKALPPPPPLAPPPPIYIPPPEILVATPQAAPTIANATTVAPAEKTAYVTKAAPKVGPTVGASVDGTSKCATPEYPASSQRNEEEGTSTVSFLIGVDGRVADKKVEKSSGYRALDNAALAAFSICKFKPALEDGVPVAHWMKIAYVWKME